MRRRRLRIVLILAMLLLIASAYLYQGGQKEEAKKISVIVYGDNEQRWANFQQGVKQAAADLNGTINFINLTDETGSTFKADLLEKELKNKTQGFIIAAADSVKMTEMVRKAANSVPVVMAETNVDIETGADGPILEYISADNEKMGAALAEEIIRDNKLKLPVYVVAVNQQRDSVDKRQKGLVTKLQQAGYEVINWRPETTDKLDSFISRMQESNEPGIVTALDTTTMEQVIDGTLEYIRPEQKAAAPAVPPIYGIGSTPKIVYYLERDFVKGIVFQDEYHLGYFSMVRLFRQVKEKKLPQADQADIKFYLANRETMHLPAYERLLYPIIQ